MLPGRNAAQSLSNLEQWLNSVAISYSPGCLAYDGQGGRLHGHYHQMKGVEADGFLGELLRQLDTWGADCTRRNVTCGRAVNISAGSGRGHMTLMKIVVELLKGETATFLFLYIFMLCD